MTVPFVVYGIFRYLYLLHRERRGSDTARDLLDRRAHARRLRRLGGDDLVDPCEPMNPHLTRAALDQRRRRGDALSRLFPSGPAGAASSPRSAKSAGPRCVVALALSLVNYGLRIGALAPLPRALGHSWNGETARRSTSPASPSPRRRARRASSARRVPEKPGRSFLAAAAAFLSERLSDLVGVILIALPGAAAAPGGVRSSAPGSQRSWRSWLSRSASGARIEGRRGEVRAPALEGSPSGRAAFDLHDGGAPMPRSPPPRRRDRVQPRRLGLRGLRVLISCSRASASTSGSDWAMSVYALSMLAGAISFLPGGLGGAEAVMMALLLIAGAPRNESRRSDAHHPAGDALVRGRDRRRGDGDRAPALLAARRGGGGMSAAPLSWNRGAAQPPCAASSRYASRCDPLLALDDGETCLAYGLGRSYGDVCLNEGGALLRTRGARPIHRLRPRRRRPQLRSRRFARRIARFRSTPQGWFLAVTPGTRFVTLGGAVANDVHGKNHHRAGSFGHHVVELELLRSGRRAHRLFGRAEPGMVSPRPSAALG